MDVYKKIWVIIRAKEMGTVLKCGSVADPSACSVSLNLRVNLFPTCDVPKPRVTRMLPPRTHVANKTQCKRPLTAKGYNSLWMSKRTSVSYKSLRQCIRDTASQTSRHAVQPITPPPLVQKCGRKRTCYLCRTFSHPDRLSVLRKCLQTFRADRPFCWRGRLTNLRQKTTTNRFSALT